MTDDDVKTLKDALWRELERQHEENTWPLFVDRDCGMVDGDVEMSCVARAAIAALKARGWQRVPEGYVVVPERPTQSMTLEGNSCDPRPTMIYRAMIAAAQEDRDQ